MTADSPKHELPDPDGTEFMVLVNHEEQHGLWPATNPIPEKWRSIGVTGSREECLAFVRRTWTDMRPLSVRRRQDGCANASADCG